MNENAIMLSVINGDVDKLGILYERYKNPLYGYFFKLTKGNSASTEDLVHNVFYKALRYKHSFKGTGEFAKWLFSIAHNTGIDYLRKENKTSHSEIGEVNSEEVDECNKLEVKEEIQQLHLAMSKLGDEEKELLIMSKLKCLKYNEIAEIYNCSEAAIKTRVFRALKKLKGIYYQLENLSYEKR